MKILSVYILFLFISLPWQGNMPFCNGKIYTVQVPLENDSNFPEPENEETENYPLEFCIQPVEKVTIQTSAEKISETFLSINTIPRNWWVQTVFAPPEL